MARILKAIRDFFLNIWYFRRNRKLNSINSKLDKAIRDRHRERKSFMKLFNKELRKYFHYDASGKYIPLKGKNKAEVYGHFMHKYGERLSELDLTFTKELVLRQ